MLKRRESAAQPSQLLARTLPQFTAEYWFLYFFAIDVPTTKARAQATTLERQQKAAAAATAILPPTE